MNDAYVQGFIDACTSRGYDAIKVATITSTKLVGNVNMSSAPWSVTNGEKPGQTPANPVSKGPVPLAKVDPKTLVPVKKK